MPLVVVDTDTGEQLYEIKVGDRLVRATSAKAYRKLTDMIELRKGDHFTKVYDDSAGLLASCGLGAREMQMFLLLLPRVQYGSCAVSDNFGRPLTSDRIAHGFSGGLRNAQLALAGLVQAGILARGKCGRDYVYLMNPYIIMRGMRVNRTLEVIFGKTKWAELARKQADS